MRVLSSLGGRRVKCTRRCCWTASSYCVCVCVCQSTSSAQHCGTAVLTTLTPSATTSAQWLAASSQPPHCLPHCSRNLLTHGRVTVLSQQRVYCRIAVTDCRPHLVHKPLWTQLPVFYITPAMFAAQELCDGRIEIHVLKTRQAPS